MILEPKKIKSVTVSNFSPSICHKVMGLDAMILVCWMLSFQSTFSLSSFMLLKFLSHSAITVVSSAYLRFLIFLLGTLIPAGNSSTLALSILYSASKLNKQGNNLQPCTPFPILNQSFVPWPVLTVASWIAYRFLRRLKTQHCNLCIFQSVSLLMKEIAKCRIHLGGQNII